MTSRERAREWIADSKRPSIILAEEACANSLAALLDAHAAERVREALERALEAAKKVALFAHSMAMEAKTAHAHQSWRDWEDGAFNAREAIRALLKEVVSNG